MASLAFVERHGQALMQAIGDRLDVERVDDQRVGQFLGRAGEAGQNKHAGVRRVLGGDEFLGHQVHAVAQRGYHAEPGEPIEAGQGGATDGAGDVADRRPVRLGIAAVDVADRAVELAAQAAVIRHFLARWGDDLQEGDALAVLGVADEQVVDRLDAVGQALRVIQPVHADGERAAVQALQQAVGGRAGNVAGGDRGEAGDVDADRRDDDLHPAAAMDEAKLAVRLDAQENADALQEGIAVVAGMKADHIAGAQRFQQFDRAGQGAEDRRRHEGGVQEEPDALLHPAGAQLVADGEHLVVVYPDQVVRPQQRDQGGGKGAVDGAVALVIRLTEGHQAQPVQQQRIQGAIGEPGVETAVIGLAEVDGGIGDAPALDDRRLGRGGGGAPAAPAEPERALGDGVGQADGETAGGGIAVARHWHPVGHDNETGHRFLLLREARKLRAVSI